MKSVFISHSWCDKPLARRLAEALRRLGIRVWIDEAEIKLGDSLIEKIRAGIDSVDYVIALVSKNSVSSKWVTKELDIAMNQEIEGRRIKVLPILVSRCDLPGFLKGKLYADMSTPRFFHRSLPMILERLEVPKETIARIRKGNLNDDFHNAEWITDLARGLNSKDTYVQYAALKNMPLFEAKNLVHHSDLLEALFRLTGETNQPQIRTRALEILGYIEDPAFSPMIETCLDDKSPHIVSAALQCLSGMGSDKSGPRVLDILRNNNDPEVRSQCFQFFSKVELRDDPTILSLVSYCKKLCEDNPEDDGLRLAYIKVIINQITSGTELAIVPDILNALQHGPDAICFCILNYVCEKGEDFWIFSADLRSKFISAILNCAKRSNPQLASLALLAILLPEHMFPQFSDHSEFWKLTFKADDATLDCLWEMFDMYLYHTEAIFDQSDDVKNLITLIGKVSFTVGERIKETLCEIGDVTALEFLSSKAYEPNNWNKVRVLRSLSRISPWNPNFNALLKASYSDLPDFCGNEGIAWALLARRAAGELTDEMVINTMPQNFNGYYLDADRDRQEIVNELQKFQFSPNSKEKRRLHRIVALLRREI